MILVELGPVANDIGYRSDGDRPLEVAHEYGLMKGPKHQHQQM